MSYDELMEKYEAKILEIEKQNIEIENLKLELSNLKRLIFGQKREYTPVCNTEMENATQCSLFTENEQVEYADEELEKEIMEKTEEITVYKRKKAKKRAAGLKKSAIGQIKFIVMEAAIPDRKCPECGAELEIIGKKLVRQEVEIIPAKIILKTFIEYKYKCPKCSDEEKNKIYEAKVPKSLLAHSFISPSLATEVIYQKYHMGVPLYRQEKVWDDRGLVLPRNMMANWCIKLSEYYLEGLYELMFEKMKAENEVMHRRRNKYPMQ